MALGKTIMRGIAVVAMAAASACGTMAARTSSAPQMPVASVEAPQLSVQTGAPVLSVVSPRVVAAVVNGEFVRTATGGKTWVREPLPPGATAAALRFISATRGWLLAWTGRALNHPAIYVTSDGGLHWKKQFAFPTTVAGGSLDMISAHDGWAIISNTLYKTTDGGTRWRAVGLPTHTRLLDLAFVSATRGWVVASTSSGISPETLFATNDGHHFHPILTSGNAIAEITLNAHGDGDVLEVGSAGSMRIGPLLKTVDGGRIWSVVTTAATLGKSGAYGFAGGMAVKGNTGWVGTNNGAQGFEANGLLVTGNGGLTWHAVGGKFGWAVQDLAMTRSGQGWIVAMALSGTYFLAQTIDNGRHWKVAWPPVSPSLVDFVNSRLGYGMGIPSDSGAILKTNDGGSHWAIETQNLPRLFTTVAFSRVLGIGVYDTYVGIHPVARLYESSNEGGSWKPLRTIRGITVSSLQSLGGSSWALMEQPGVGSVTRVAISHDSGKHWIRARLAISTGSLVSVVRGGQAWVFANRSKQEPSPLGRLWSQNLAGTTRKLVLTLPEAGSVQYLINGMDFLNSRTGWIVATKYAQSHQFIHKPGMAKKVRAAPAITNLLYYTQDGGRRWAAWRLPKSWMINGLDLVTPEVGFLDVNGTLLKTTDGGKVWRLAVH